MSAIHSYDLRSALARSWTSTSSTAWQVDGSITAIDNEIEEIEGDRLPANSSTLDDLDHDDHEDQIDDCEDNSLQVSQGQNNLIEAFTEGGRPTTTTTPVFIGCDDGSNAVAGEVKIELEHDVEPEQIVIKIEPGLDELADADGLTATNNYDPEHERICLDDVFEEKFNPATSNYDEFRNITLTAGSTLSSSSSNNLTNVDKDFAARIKQAFGSLSSRYELGFDDPLDEKLNPTTSNHGTSSPSTSYDVDDKDLALRIKQEFGTLSSSFLETPPPPRSRIKLDDDRSVVVDQKERCLTELSKLFPTIDYMEILDVLVYHQWALGVSIRYLRSTLVKAEANVTTAGAVAEPVRHVISSFSVDHKREAAHKIAIKEKERCLHQLCEQFPMTDFLELQNVLVAHRWSVKAAIDYLEARAISIKNSHLPRCQKVIESDVVIEEEEEEEPNDDLPTDLADKIKRAFTSLSSGLNLALKAESRIPDEETDKGTQCMRHKRLKKLADSKKKLGASNDKKSKSLIGKNNFSIKANGLPKRKAAIAATNKLALFDFEDNIAGSHKQWEQKKKWRARKLRRERRARFASLQTG